MGAEILKYFIFSLFTYFPCSLNVPLESGYHTLLFELFLFPYPLPCHISCPWKPRLSTDNALSTPVQVTTRPHSRFLVFLIPSGLWDYVLRTGRPDPALPAWGLATHIPLCHSVATPQASPFRVYVMFNWHLYLTIQMCFSMPSLST